MSSCLRRRDKRCRVVTPILTKVYNNIIKTGRKFGMVYIPFDKDEKSFLRFMATMPWLTLPLGHPGASRALPSR